MLPRWQRPAQRQQPPGRSWWTPTPTRSTWPTDPTSGDLFYANFDGGQIRRIQYTAANNAPLAVASASPTSGPAPLTVQFTGSGSSDPDGDRDQLRMGPQR